MKPLLLTLALLLALLAAPARAKEADAPPGPLVIKAFLHAQFFNTDDPPIRGADSRAYVLLQNPTKDDVRLLEAVGTFHDLNGDLLFRDELPLDQVPAEQRREGWLAFPSGPRLQGIRLLCRFTYELAGKVYRQEFEVSTATPSHPPGWIPSDEPAK